MNALNIQNEYMKQLHKYSFRDVMAKFKNLLNIVILFVCCSCEPAGEEISLLAGSGGTGHSTPSLASETRQNIHSHTKAASQTSQLLYFL